MPANTKVSVAWQIVFTFLPIVNFWAFYRIRKLRKYVLYVIVPEIVLSIIIAAYTIDDAFNTLQSQTGDAANVRAWSDPWGAPTIVSYIVSAALQGLAIYLVIIWSRLHNRRVDASTGQALG